MIERHRKLFLFLALLLTFAVYSPSLTNGYAMDDRLAAMGVANGGKHPMIADLRPVGDYFREPYWKGNSERDLLFRPVTVYSYALVHHFFKPPVPDFADEVQAETAFPNHLINILLHLVAALIVYGLLRALRVSATASILSAFVFGVHAVHSEVVANIVGRAELFAFCFGGGATLLLFGTRTREWFVRMPAALTSMGLLFLAFGSKESALAWVGFLVVYGIALHWRQNPGAPWIGLSLKRTGCCLALATIPVAAFTWFWMGMIDRLPAGPIEIAVYTVNPIADAPIATRFATAVFILAYKGLGLVLFPFDLSANYGASVLPILTSLLDPRFIGAFVLLAALLIGGLWAGGRHPLLFLGVCTFFGFTFITSNVPLAVGTIFAERLLYAPSFALVFLCAWIAERASARWESWRDASPRPLLYVVAGLWLGASMLVILQRNSVWESDDALFLHEAANQSRSTRMLVCAASVHSERGERTTATRYIKEALRLDPEYALAWNNLAALYIEQQRWAEAEEAARQGLLAKHTDPDQNDAFKLNCNMGLTLRRQGRPLEALHFFQESLVCKPKFQRAWDELVSLGKELGSPEPVFATLAQAEKRVKNTPYWALYRGQAQLEVGELNKARESFRAALEIDPTLAKARVRLLTELAAKGDPEESLRLVAEGERHASHRAEWSYFRGLALARKGQVEAALRAFVETLDRAPDYVAAWQDLVAVASEKRAGAKDASSPSNSLDLAAAILAEREAARPEVPYWPFFGGQIMARQGKLEDGMAAMCRALSGRPDFTGAWRELNAMAAAGPGPETLLAMIQQSGADRSEAQWPFYRAAMLQQLGRLIEASDAFADAVRRDPAFVDARIALLSLIYDGWEPSEVRTLIRDGLALAPDNAHWPLFSGLLLHREGEIPQAASALTKALMVFKNHPIASFALADCLVKLGQTKDAAARFGALAKDENAPPAMREQASRAAATLGARATAATP